MKARTERNKRGSATWELNVVRNRTRVLNRRSRAASSRKKVKIMCFYMFVSGELLGFGLFVVQKKKKKGKGIGTIILGLSNHKEKYI